MRVYRGIKGYMRVIKGYGDLSKSPLFNVPVGL